MQKNLTEVKIFQNVLAGYFFETPCIYTVSGKKDRQYFGRNFDKFRQLFIIFGMNHPDNPCD